MGRALGDVLFQFGLLDFDVGSFYWGKKDSWLGIHPIYYSSKSTIGSPLVEGARIEAKILDQIRNKKIIVFKKRRRQNYRSTQGHRQYLTVLQIQSISLGKKKSETSKKTLDKKPSQKKTKMETSSAKKAAPKKASAEQHQ